MLSIALLATPAFALNCDDLEPQLCNAVEQMAASLQPSGSPVLTDEAPARLRPATVYGQLATLQQATVAGGCQVQPTLTGWSVGTYGPDDRFLGQGSDATAIAGRFQNPARTSSLPVRLRDRPRSIVGSWTDGGGETALGARFGGYTGDGRLLADVGAEHLAGHWIRLKGRQGVFVALTAGCDGAVAAPDALAPWYGEPLAKDVRDLQIAFDFDEVNGLTASVDVTAQDAADLGEMTLQLRNGDELQESVGVVFENIEWNYRIPVPPTVATGTPPTLEAVLTEFAKDGSAVGAPLSCGLVAVDGSSCTVSREGLERVITWIDGGIEVDGETRDLDGDGIPEGDIGQAKLVVQGGGGSTSVTAPPRGRWTQVAIVHSQISQACAGLGWDCSPSWTWAATVRGTDGFTTGSAGGVLELTAQFGEILIDGVVWEVE